MNKKNSHLLKNSPLIKSLICATIIVSLTACGSDSDLVINGETATVDRLFLQQVSSTSAIVKWRSGPDLISVGTNSQNLNQQFSAQDSEGNHKEAKLTGLKADTTYYYSVGSANALTDNQAKSYQFHTSPVKGEIPSHGKTRIWLVGDSGTVTDAGKHDGEAQQVLDGFTTFNQDQPLDLFVMLGDNAYTVGRDADYQKSVFELYPSILSTTPVWSTLGNHEMGGSILMLPEPSFKYLTGQDCSPDDDGKCALPYAGASLANDPSGYDDLDSSTTDNGLPYLDIFSFPTQGEVGGVPSGTELYYSFDYANVHIISLDSQISARDTDKRSAMKSWLVSDLDANDQDWTVVIFHHPPYSKGKNHDSDHGTDQLDPLALALGLQRDNSDRPIGYMREEFNALFESKGVDLVYSGHAHSYERSYYISGHTGTSDTFDVATHADTFEGIPTITGYQQTRDSSNLDDKVVYTVNGSSGKADMGALNHPAHRAFDSGQVLTLSPTISEENVLPNGLALKGSVVVDATATTLTASFIDVNGIALDSFSISK